MTKDRRRRSSVVRIGNLPLGGKYPIRVQSMINVSTLDTDGSIQQCVRIIEAGGEYIRLAVQGLREVENLKKIKEGLAALGYDPPLIADVHFHPKIAEEVARLVEKVRINPGNFADSRKTTYRSHVYSLEEDQAEFKKVKKRFVSFLNICKKYHTAIRIGVNHGSLSKRILNRYGDSSQGMVFSCMEFLRICVEEDFLQVVVSIKASHTVLMVQTVRLLVKQMEKEGMSFPLHLGVTEAGEGEDGRIKSAVGIGTLLLEGIGDTIRVSLSEDPEAEIPVARLLMYYIKEKNHLFQTEYFVPVPKEEKTKREIYVIADRSRTSLLSFHPDFIPDFIYIGQQETNNMFCPVPIIVDFSVFSSQENTFPLFTVQEKEAWATCQASWLFLSLSYSELSDEIITLLKKKPQTVVLIYAQQNNIYEQKAVVYALIGSGINNSLILRETYQENDLETFQIKSSIDCGSFLLDQLVEGIMLGNLFEPISAEAIEACSFSILQSTGRKITKTEYIACPGCGRTSFDLQTVLKKIKKATVHLKGLKIAVMGCIVNGPGEMADADFGYIGAGKGQINLYQGKICIRRNVPEEQAVEELLALISLSIKKKKEDLLVLK